MQIVCANYYELRCMFQKKQTYMKTETCKLYSRVVWTFKPNFIKNDRYYFKLCYVYGYHQLATIADFVTSDHTFMNHHLGLWMITKAIFPSTLPMQAALSGLFGIDVLYKFMFYLLTCLLRWYNFRIVVSNCDKYLNPQVRCNCAAWITNNHNNNEKTKNTIIIIMVIAVFYIYNAAVILSLTPSVFHKRDAFLSQN